MIGHLGDNALAGVGFANFLFFVGFSMMLGVGAAIQTMTARRLGENIHSLCGVPLNAGLIILVCYAIPITVVMVGFSTTILGLFSSDPEVVHLAVSYFKWRIIGLLAIGIAISFRGFWNGIKKPNTYAIILIGTHILNIVLNWVLIFGHLGAPAMGVKGAAIGSTVSLYCGAVAYIVYTIYKQSSLQVLTKLPQCDVFKALIRVGWPSGLDQLLFSLHLMGLFWIFGQIGTEAAAVAHVVIVCVLLLYLPGVGLGLASLSLVSEALGKGTPKDAKQWAWDVIRLGIPVIICVGGILFCFSRPILGQFFNTPSTLEMAIFPLRLDLLTLWMTCLGTIIIESLIGAGDTRLVMIIKVVSRWVFLIPGAYVIGVHFGYGINAVWMYWVVVNLLESLVFIGIWQRERWMGIRV